MERQKSISITIANNIPTQRPRKTISNESSEKKTAKILFQTPFTITKKNYSQIQIVIYFIIFHLILKIPVEIM